MVLVIETVTWGHFQISPRKYFLDFRHANVAMTPLVMNVLARNSRLRCIRSYASVSGNAGANPYTVGPFQVFDRRVKKLQKDRAAGRDDGERSRTVDYVRDEISVRMMERFLVSLCFLKGPESPRARTTL